MATLENLLSPALVERLGWTLIHFVWQAAAVALLLAIVLRILRKCSASMRYVVGCLALLLIVALPLVTMALVEVSEPVAEAGPAPIPTPVPETTPVAVIEVAELPAMQIDAQPLEMPKVSAPWTQRAVTALEPALPWLVLGWLLGVFGLSAWHLGGWAQLQRMKRRMVSEVAASLQAKLAELAAALGIKRAVALLESALVDVPTVIGWIKPVILLPASALSGLSPEQLEAILAHELAHVRRYDYLVNIAQTVIEILGFYHPALWWISHKIRAERENCCDDLAVQVCGDSLRYARALTCLEEMRHHHSELAVAASGGSLVARIGRLLSRPAADDRRFTWLPGLIALLLVAAAIIPTALVLAAPNRRQPEPSAPQNAEAAAEEPTRVILDIRTVFVHDDKILGPDVVASLRSILGPTDAPTYLDARNDITANDLFATQVAKRTLPNQTALTLTDTLYRGGYVQYVSNPQYLAQAGRQTHISLAYDRAPLVTTPLTPFEVKMKELCAGLALDVTPNVSDNDEVLLKINVEQADPEHAGGEDVSRRAAGKTIDRLAILHSGECCTLPVASPISTELPGSLYVIVTTWIHRVEAEAAKKAASNEDEEQRPQPMAEAKTSPQAEGDPQSGTRIIIDYIFAKVLTEKGLDHETTVGIQDLLGAEQAQALDDVVDFGSQPKATLGEFLRAHVVGKPLTSSTTEALIDLLESRGYLKRESRPQILTSNNQQTQMNVTAAEQSTLEEHPKAALQQVELGTFVQATPHFAPEAADRITLEIAAKWTELAGVPPAGKLPTVSTTEMASTVTVPRDRFFALLLEPDGARTTPQADRQAKLVLFRADCLEPPVQQRSASVPPAPQSESQPRQVLLDVQIVEMEGDNLRDLGIEWGSPRISAGSFGAAGASGLPWGVQVGYTPDREFTNALQVALRRLHDQGRVRFLARPQITAIDGRQSRLAITSDDRYLSTPGPTATDPQPPSELVTVTSGTTLSVTPTVRDNDEITLEIATEHSDSIPQPAPALPMVTRRTSRNVVTVQNGGTVALAGFSDSKAQVAILVTAALAPEHNASPRPAASSVALPPATSPLTPGVPGTSETSPRRFVHTDVNDQIDREFGFEELIHSEQNRWTVTKPYMDLFGSNFRCTVAAERGRIQLETVADQTTPGDATFSGNVIVDIRPAGPKGPVTFALYVDKLTYDAEKGCLSSSGPVRFVCGGTEFIGRGLELYCRLAPSRPAGDRIKTIGSVSLYMTPSNALIVTLDDRQSASEAAQVRVQEGQSAPSSQNTGFHIRLDFTVLKVAADARLDAETAAQASRWLSAADSNETAANAWPLSELRKHTVDQLLETLQREVPAESFGTFVDLLTSRRYATVLFNPALVVAEGRQAEIAVSDEVKLAVVAEAESDGHAVRMATRLDLTVRDPVSQPNDPEAGPESAPVTFQTNGSLAIQWANNRGYALRRLTNTATAATAKATTDIYYLLVRPVLVVPLKASKAMASTAFERDLLKVLDEIATRTGQRIQVDETVKPQPVAADLETVGFVEVVLPRVLENTPYIYRRLGDDAYLVYRPITATFRGDDLPQAIQDIAFKAGVTIVSDPNVSGEIYADLRDVPLETALDILLAGSPFVATKRPDYYLVAERDAVEQEAVSVEARFVLLDKALMEALQRGLPIEGVTASEDVNALHAIGADLLANETPLLGPAQVELLLTAVRGYGGSKSLAAPRVTVPDGESASFSLTEPLDYVSGYREPNDASGDPIPLSQSRNIGVAFDVTPRLIENDNVRVGFDMEINSLLDMQTAMYQGTYKYDIPVFETVAIQTEIVIPDGHTVMIRGGEMRSLHGTQPSKDQPDRHLIILIKPQKTEISPVASAPSMSSELNFGPGGMMGGMGAFGPETTPRMRRPYRGRSRQHGLGQGFAVTSQPLGLADDHLKKVDAGVIPEVTGGGHWQDRLGDHRLDHQIDQTAEFTLAEL